MADYEHRNPETWSELFAFLSEPGGSKGVAEHLEIMLDVWDALGKPELHLDGRAVIHDLRHWFSRPVLLSDLSAVSREIRHLDGCDRPLVPDYEDGGVIYPTYRATTVN